MDANKYQLEQAKKFIPYFAEIERYGLDYLLVTDNDAFEWWDNIAVEEYIKRGGVWFVGNEPKNPDLFEDCQNWANDLIEGVLE